MDTKQFPLSEEALTAFEDLKEELETVTLRLQRIDESLPLWWGLMLLTSQLLLF